VVLLADNDIVVAETKIAFPVPAKSVVSSFMLLSCHQ